MSKHNWEAMDRLYRQLVRFVGHEAFPDRGTSEENAESADMMLNVGSVEARVCDMHFLPYEDQSFDLVLARDVLGYSLMPEGER